MARVAGDPKAGTVHSLRHLAHPCNTLECVADDVLNEQFPWELPEHLRLGVFALVDLEETVGLIAAGAVLVVSEHSGTQARQKRLAIHDIGP